MAQSVTLIHGVTAFLWVILGMVIGKVLGNIARRWLKMVDWGRRFKIRDEEKVEIAYYVSVVLRFICYSGGIVYGLRQLGVSSRFLIGVLIVVVVLVGIFIVLAVKDYIPNMLAGWYIKRTQKLKKGDKITLKNIQGEIVHIGWLETKMQAKDELVFIPNAVLNKSELTKESKY